MENKAAGVREIDAWHGDALGDCDTDVVHVARSDTDVDAEAEDVDNTPLALDSGDASGDEQLSEPNGHGVSSHGQSVAVAAHEKLCD